MIDEFDPPKNKKKYDFSSQELLPSQKKRKRKLLQSVTLKYHLIWIKPYVLSFFPGGSNSGKKWSILISANG